VPEWQGGTESTRIEIELLMNQTVPEPRFISSLRTSDNGESRTSVPELPGQKADAGELYRSLFEESHSVMLIIDPETGDILDANASACSYYKYEKAQLTRMQIMDINTLSPDEVREEMQKAKKEERSHFEFRHRLATGEVRDVEVYCTSLELLGKQVLYSIIHDTTERLRLDRERQQTIEQLEKAQEEIQTLRGILPLCSFCKKIRDDEGNWERVDVYILKHSQADISHSICPDCVKEYYPDG